MWPFSTWTSTVSIVCSPSSTRGLPTVACQRSPSHLIHTIMIGRKCEVRAKILQMCLTCRSYSCAALSLERRTRSDRSSFHLPSGNLPHRKSWHRRRPLSSFRLLLAHKVPRSSALSRRNSWPGKFRSRRSWRQRSEPKTGQVSHAGSFHRKVRPPQSRRSVQAPRTLLDTQGPRTAWATPLQ